MPGFWWTLTHDKNAADTADEFGYFDAPKLKFNYTVSIGPRINIPYEGADEMGSILFALKQTTRPNININYSDINFYGYRTKVATRTDYGTMTITFYDDNKNRAHGFFKSYLNSVSPISNSTKEQATNLESTMPNTIGPLGNKYGPLQYIRVTHHFSDNNQGSIKKTHYDYLNPKLQNVILDELDMTQSDTNSVTLTFLYDSVNIIDE